MLARRSPDHRVNLSVDPVHDSPTRRNPCRFRRIPEDRLRRHQRRCMSVIGSKDPRRNNAGLLRRVARVEGVVPFAVEFVSVKGE